MTSTTVKPITTTTATPSAATVRTEGYAFTPTSIRISVGQSVTFTVSSSHDVTWRNGDTGRGATGAAYSRTFSTAGSFSFFCSIHEEMTGTITVG
jgi:plastocyanin